MRGLGLQRAAWHCIVIAMLCCFHSVRANPGVDAVYDFDIPAQNLGSALQSVAIRAHLQILMMSELVEDNVAPSLNATLSVEGALKHLLADTSLTFEIIPYATVLIREQPAHVASREGLRSGAGANDASSGLRDISSAAGKNKEARPAPASMLDQIVVTARKREENLQQVPIAISALESDELVVRGLNNMGDLSGVLPNVKIGGGPYNGNAGTSYRMRGIAGVEVYQDGVSTSSSGGALPLLADVERVEILRGPQGTLFGKNAVGGAIQIITRLPEEKAGGRVVATAGSNGRQDLVAALDLPLSDRLLTRFSTSALNRDGFVHSTKINADFGSQHDLARSVDVLWRPVERFSARLQLGSTRRSSNGTPHVNLSFHSVCPGDAQPSQYVARDGRAIHQAPNAICILQNAPIDYGSVEGTNALEFQSYGARRQYVNTVDDASLSSWWQKTQDIKLDLRLQLNEKWSARSISSRRWGSSVNPSSLDGTGLELAYRSNELELENDATTSELQLQFSGKWLEGTTGLYFERNPGFLDKRVPWLHSELLRPGIREAAEAWLGYPLTELHLTSRPVNLGNMLGVMNSTESVQSAAFAEWTLNPGGNLRVTGGLRYTRQDSRRTTYRPEQSINQVPGCCHLDPGIDYLAVSGEPRIYDSRFTQWTPRASVQYQWSDDVMAYVSYSKGAIAGGVNTPSKALTGLDPYPYYPQIVRNYEIGLRSDLLSGRLRLNATAFHDDYENVQVSEEIYPGIGVINRAQGRVGGLEIEGAWLPMDRLSLSFALGWLNSEYTDLGNTQLLLADTPFPLAPTFTMNLGIERQWLLGSRATLSARLDYTTERSTVNVVDRLNQAEIPAYHLLGSNVTFAPAGARWTASLSATNLTNDYYWTSVFAPPGDQYSGASLARPREFALTFSWQTR